MLHAKFQEHRTSGSGEDFFFKFFLPHMGYSYSQESYSEKWTIFSKLFFAKNKEAVRSIKH